METTCSGKYFDETREFGATFSDSGTVNPEYDFENKTLVLNSSISGETYSCNMKSSFPSSGGCTYDFEFTTNPVAGKNASYSFHREYDSNYNLNTDTYSEKSENLKPVADKEGETFGTRLFIDDGTEKKTLFNLRKFLKTLHENGEPDTPDIELIERNNGSWWIELGGDRHGQMLKNLGLYDVPFRNLVCAHDGDDFTLLVGSRTWIVLKDDEIIDTGVMDPLRFMAFRGLIYEVAIPEGKMLMGMAVHMGY